MNNEVLKAMKTRRSIRKYKPEQITDEQLDAILEAGTYAATGMGKQSPIIIAVTNKELRGSAETGTDRKTFEDERGCDGKQQ